MFWTNWLQDNYERVYMYCMNYEVFNLSLYSFYQETAKINADLPKLQLTENEKPVSMMERNI